MAGFSKKLDHATEFIRFGNRLPVKHVQNGRRDSDESEK